MTASNNTIVSGPIGQPLITGYTAAQLSALAAAGRLTPYATYVASDTGERRDATSSTNLVPSNPQPTGPLLCVWVGNSIVNYGFFGGLGALAGFPDVSEMGYAQALCGGRIWQESTVTSATSLDICGNWGHTGVTSATILTDVSTHLAALDLARVVPQVVVLAAIAENDIATDVASATSILNIAAIIKAYQAHYPGVLICLATPRPDGHSNGNTARKAAAQAIYDYCLSRDDGKTIFAANLKSSGYEDPANEWCPLTGYTYASNTGDALSTISVHPRQNAASMNGRVFARAFMRMIGQPVNSPAAIKSTNEGLVGSTSIASGKFTGNGPTAAAAATQPTGTGATVVSSVPSSGEWRLVFTPDAGQLADNFQVNLTALTPASLPQRFGVAGRVKINSGAASISSISARVVVIHSDASTATLISMNSANATAITVQSAVYADGDELFFYTAPMYSTAAKFPSTYTCYVRVYSNGAGPIDVSISQIGVMAYNDNGARSTMTVPATTVPYQNRTGTIQRLIISGGTVTSIDVSRLGVTFDTIAPNTTVPVMWSLLPGEWIKFTYSVVPTVVILPQ